jgi:signal transduction histidine kinase/ligand-binding sensor domain-containing protein
VSAFGAMLTGALLLARPAHGLSPELDVSQYAHTSWTIRDGFTRGTIVAIAQTQDGYLWLGTEFGLLRFDGVRHVLWQPPAGQVLPSSYIRTLLAARDGTLWIGTAKGLARWKDGNLTSYAELDGQAIWALLEDRKGRVWAGGQAFPTSRLCAIQGTAIQCHGEDGRFGQYIDTLHEDQNGTIWVGGVAGLWRWDPVPERYAIPDRVQALTNGENGALVIVTYSGIRQLVNGKLETYPIPPTAAPFAANSILRDRDGGLWIGTIDRGLVHVHHGRVDVFAKSDGLSGDFIFRIFEDREGNIWVATLDGLDRFRDLAVSTISTRQGLTHAAVQSVLVAKDHSVWLATLNGLNRWENGKVTVYRKSHGLQDDVTQSLYQDSRGRVWVSTRRGIAFFENGRFTPVNGVPGGVEAFAEDTAGNLWVSQIGSLFRLREKSVVEQIAWTKLGQKEVARSLVPDPIDGGVWLAFTGAVLRLQGGQIRASYSVADGLGAGHIRDLQRDRQGALWASTENGASRLKDGRVATLTSRNGLPCDDAQWVMEDDDQSVWLYMECGLVRVRRKELDAWADAASHEPARRIGATLFDTSDGVRSHDGTTGCSPSVAKSADGRLWFLPWDGVSVINPARLPFNALPPPVHIERITADRQIFAVSPNATASLRLPPRLRDLEIDYTALSLVGPEKVRFRYKLEGRDPDWHDVGTRRQAFYGDLAPGHYRFRVSASNNSGVWNEAGAFVDFAVAPAYYQTAWFQFLIVGAALALLAALYLGHVRQVAKQLNVRFEERLTERTRIAQELHDTLLQGFVSASMQLHVAVEHLPEDSPAKSSLGRVLDLMARVTKEGRNAVRGLRAASSTADDLERALLGIPEELAVSLEASYRVISQGEPRLLIPMIRDEVYRIAREAVVNAFRHSGATSIEVEVGYLPRELRVFVRDDGRGIAQPALDSQSDGHWGITGMRERARAVGASVKIRSRPAAGTEVELIVPGHVAFARDRARRPVWWPTRWLASQAEAPVDGGTEKQP